MGEYNFDASAFLSNLSKRDQQLFTKSEPTQDYEDIKKATKDFVKAVGEKYADSSSIQGERAHSDGPLPSGWSAGEEDRTRARSSSTKATEPVFMKKAKTDDVGFGGLDQDHYAECYPGGMEEVDATVNSDDEIDFSKMDVGNCMETISHQGKHYQKLLSSIALKWMTVVRLVDKVSRMRKLNWTENGSRSVRFFKKESQVKQSLIPSASRL
ncbi:PREDICTED: uncharacterized protein LOC100636507 isoform X1 [Amphimedon queenslandica]|uniref:Protein RED C-terminal domain-containing protein n=1 Tax=Amphimedon queenslandica TaxID=400682 RepID=A0AAN0JPW6_AMPQE|nr:PREDICTED: uncharacterized protein LOC100636507 isoform X1 [Amphimedon queenslandica]XP_019859090.1 PREDICTED: uncharacterized protein LOC100636507 isoform X1 [Amphimedon queenslandica]XP_019859091.1 PREDICTED: uncharacterized protein LOC100636507 isoform X1 [Amphimedon queenslandica]XP_019859092.1 PREDICTED: uncharacterized protein LOC100636507 isoform X1 [Amphimedon queenslandica]|eukprot:XP_019859089.1 PREDICTED: uncharacterized protein LOC100636507 isoform X1 [Amphimedon queenslandica]